MERKLIKAGDSGDARYALPEPVVLGLPERFTDWRKMQQMAVVLAEESGKRFVLQCAPTGFGKSLVYMANAKMLEGSVGGRTIILTSTKGLQDQLGRDFPIADVRGKNAYVCIKAADFGMSPETSVADGACHLGVSCAEKEGGCGYYAAIRQAASASVVVTNYAFWLHAAEVLGKFDLMVMDEAHDAADILSDFLSVELDEEDVQKIGGSVMGNGASYEDWGQWARFHLKGLRERLDGMKKGGTRSTRTLREWESLVRKVERIAGLTNDWVIEDGFETIGVGLRARKSRVVHFNPLWPDKYAEKTLFMGVKKVVMFSATVRPKTAHLLGLKNSEFDFFEYPSTFPVERRPNYYVPTVKMGFKTSEGEMMRWMSRIDEIIRERTDRKGIIHTVSFKRRNFILANSSFSSLMLTNDSRNTRDIVRDFKAATRPCILVSPSMTTGWDFPYSECEYQIIGKVMFPDTQTGVMKARQLADKDYSSYIAMQNLVQATGRGMRAEDDLCECFIIDNNFGDWFIKKYKDFAPKWWLDALKTSVGVPKPLTKL